MGKDNTIALEAFTENDFDRFIHWMGNEWDMCQFAGTIFTFPLTSQQLSEYISVANRKLFKVIDVETGRVIGHAEIDRINPRNKNARLCRILIAKKEDRNKGYGQMLIRKLLNIGFKEMNLHRIDLGVFDFNASAIRAYEKCGFKKEGLLRGNTLIENKFYSVYNMSILRHEWEAAANLPES